MSGRSVKRRVAAGPSRARVQHRIARVKTREEREDLLDPFLQGMKEGERFATTFRTALKKVPAN
jgi:hypothetical protein